MAGGGARSDGGVEVVTGSKGRRGGSHRAREVEVKLKVALAWRGALRDGDGCSSEWVAASGGSGGRRGRRCSSPQGKTKAWLDAGECGECRSVIGKERGGRMLTGRVTGEEADGGAALEVTLSSLQSSRG